MSERDDNEIVARLGRLRVATRGDRIVKTALPGAKLRLPRCGRRRPFVGDVVGNPRERVDGRHMRPHRRREKARRDGKILVVRPRQALARGVRTGQRLLPGRARHTGIVKVNLVMPNSSDQMTPMARFTIIDA